MVESGRVPDLLTGDMVRGSSRCRSFLEIELDVPVVAASTQPDVMCNGACWAGLTVQRIRVSDVMCNGACWAGLTVQQIRV